MRALTPAINLQFGQSGFCYQDVISPRFCKPEQESKPPAKGRVRLRLVARFGRTLFGQELLADGRMLTVVQTRRRRTRRRQIRRHRTGTEVETRIHETASTPC